MAQVSAFTPQGYSYMIVGTSAGTTPFCVGSTSYSTGGVSGIQGVHVTNVSTGPAYIAFGSSSVLAGYPTTSAISPALCVVNGQSAMFTCPPNAWLSAATSVGSAGTVIVTPGYGIY